MTKIPGNQLAPDMAAALAEAAEGLPHGASLSVEPVPLDLILVGDNDRKKFDQAALRELAGSIMENGLGQPIILRRIGPDHYQIVAGERRYRAFCLLHQADPSNWRFASIPAIVRELDDHQASALMLVENTARKDLNPMEEASGYHRRMVCEGWTVEKCATVAGVGVQRVRNRLDLLKLRDDIQELIRSGNLDPLYGSIVANAGLDQNFQGLAMRALNNNSSPTPAWMRRTCAELLEQQAQSSLFDLFALPPAVQQTIAAPEVPPTPATTVPPPRGRHPLNILSSQARFWRDAAEKWDRLGKSRQRAECLAAAQALETAVKLIETASPPPPPMELFTIAGASRRQAA